MKFHRNFSIYPVDKREHEHYCYDDAFRWEMGNLNGGANIDWNRLFNSDYLIEIV